MEDFLLAPLVVAARMPLLWLEMVGLGGPGRRESERMVTEKVAAFQQGFIAAQVELLKASFAVSDALARGASPAPAMVRASRRIQAVATRPASRLMRANAKRLTVY